MVDGRNGQANGGSMVRRSVSQRQFVERFCEDSDNSLSSGHEPDPLAPRSGSVGIFRQTSLLSMFQPNRAKP
jgi:hypothetical protein